MTVGSDEAKTRLAELLDKVAAGEKVTITRHGAPIAKLVPIDSRKRRDVREVIQDMIEFGKGRALGGISIKELIEEGRRYGSDSS